MTPERSTRLAELIGRHETELLTEWLRVQQDGIARRRDLISDQELQAQSREFLALLTTALQQGGTTRAGRLDVVVVDDWRAERCRELFHKNSLMRGPAS